MSKNGVSTTIPLKDLVNQWGRSVGVDPKLLPDPASLSSGGLAEASEAAGPGVDRARIDDWEHRHGFSLPKSLRAWLALSDGFYLDGPLIHPLSAIGPMIPFAKVPHLLVQPESWFELGNPNVETVCIDLGYQWPGGGYPIFTSGDDESGSPPRVIAPSFRTWFLELLRQGGREYWFDPGFESLGHPWRAHRRHAPTPPLPDRLRPLAQELQLENEPVVDDRLLASRLGISRSDVEAILRHLQHQAVFPTEG